MGHTIRGGLVEVPRHNLPAVVGKAAVKAVKSVGLPVVTYSHYAQQEMRWRLFEPKIFKTQKTTLGYNAKDILKIVHEVTTMGGYKKKEFRIGHGMWTREFDFLEDTPTHITIQSGLVQYKILK